MSDACCKPRTCCRGGSEPRRADECMCGCFCLNGNFQVSTAMLLTCIGSIFSLASLGDCAFVVVEDEFPLPELYEGSPETRRLGYLTFETADGRCYWYTEGFDPEDQIRKYFELLGSDWQVGRIFLAGVCAFAWLAFLYSFSLCCTSQVKGIRYFLAVLHSFGLALFQSLSFLIFGSPFCAEYSCTMDRSAGFSIAAACSYWLAGFCYLCMSNYPGPNGFVPPPRGNSTDKEDKEDDDSESVSTPVLSPSQDEDVEIGAEAPSQDQRDILLKEYKMKGEQAISGNQQHQSQSSVILTATSTAPSTVFSSTNSTVFSQEPVDADASVIYDDKSLAPSFFTHHSDGPDPPEESSCMSKALSSKEENSLIMAPVAEVLSEEREEEEKQDEKRDEKNEEKEDEKPSYVEELLAMQSECIEQENDVVSIQGGEVVNDHEGTSFKRLLVNSRDDEEKGGVEVQVAFSVEDEA